jgi:hypothetical protein
VPHKERFEVLWAALIDAHGHFLIERHVLRVSPSLRLAHQRRSALDSSALGTWCSWATLDRLDFLHCDLPRSRSWPWRRS